jgi:hypothetical protein
MWRWRAKARRIQIGWLGRYFSESRPMPDTSIACAGVAIACRHRRYYQLIESFGRLTRVPMVLNTSFVTKR